MTNTHICLLAKAGNVLVMGKMSGIISAGALHNSSVKGYPTGILLKGRD